MKLDKEIKEKRSELTTLEGVIFHQDNARPHTSLVTRKKSLELGWKVMPRPPYTRSLRNVSGLPLYLRAIVFERPLRGMNANSKASRTYRLLADICQTYSSCAARLCLQRYF